MTCLRRRLLLRRLPHVSIDGSAEGRKGDAAARHRLRSRALGQDAAGQAARRDAVAEVILGAQALDAALDAREERADLAEVARHGPRPRAHVLEARLQLLAEGEGGVEGFGGVGALQGGWRIVLHLGRGRRLACSSEERAM